MKKFLLLLQRKVRFSLSTFTYFMINSIAIAGNLDGISTTQIAVFSPLLSAYSGGSICNFLIKPDSASKYLDEKLGGDTRYKNSDVAGLFFLYVGQQGMQASMGVIPTTKKDKVVFCNSMLAAFGPSGTQIKGVLEP